MTNSVNGYSAKMKRAVLVTIAMVCALLVGSPATAVTITGLYNADVPISDSSSSSVKAGYEAGLREVLVRVSGSRDVLELEGIDQLLSKAESLVLAYQVGQSQGQSRMQMSFGAVGVNRGLAALDAPVWGANRPLTLAWIAVEDRGQRQLITGNADASSETDSGAEWRQYFMAAASERGLPMVFPDSQFSGDRSLLSDLWGQFVDRLEAASEGQAYDVITLMRISRSGGQWRAGWVFDGMGMDASERSASAGTPAELATKVVDQWAEFYASRYAVAAGNVADSPAVDVVLDGVTSLADYGRVVKALQSMTPVRSVGASRIRDERLTLEVAFSGELNQLQEYIALDPRFVAQSSEDAAPAEVAESPEATGAVDQRANEGVAEAPDATGPAYQALPEGDEQDAADAFESLYEVLYYRWQRAPGRGDSNS
ncbi:DUF2066 domain-containing protein [Marinobacter sp. S0848L]|uniref:DUF2066 domain-containing protein n=1 Tax=Marinobacter sp. S0848L TaxID=2926423 RepID=UPI001FF4C848|nr:DUF2066 domain-containing protein [Marinobacter sp. S0848L]MCK0106401.1 DUF2066 domain-containing protein [Marinobacter sp. S0848L]